MIEIVSDFQIQLFLSQIFYMCITYSRQSRSLMKQQNKPAEFYVKDISPNEREVHMNNTYTIAPDHKYYEVILFVIDLINEKNRLEKKKYHNVFQISYFPTLEFELAKCKMEQQKCMICLEEYEIKDIEKELAAEYDDDVLMLGCSHKYHKTCLLKLIGDKKWAKCAICATIFGHMTGDQPEGTMTHYLDNNLKCNGYAKGTIIINYNMKGGNRNGKYYPGTSRTAYLPNTPEGQEVFQLLTEAFNRKLIFTVGRSVTTGIDNQVVWNGIHHKTTTSGGAASFGYPDPTYFSRVKEELAAKGVVPKK